MSEIDTLQSGTPSLVYSTYLGGNSEDCWQNGGERECGIAVDSAGYVYVAGPTYSSNFPTTAGGYDRTCGTDGNCNGGQSSDMFLAKLDLTTGVNGLVYGTYLSGGGSQCFRTCAIALDGSNNVYVAGQTTSTDFPATTGQMTYGGGGYDTFVVKFNLGLSGTQSLVYGTFLGGTGQDNARAIAVGTNGDATVVGTTDTSTFPITPGAFDTSFSDVSCGVYECRDGYVARLNQNGQLLYSSYLGGNSDDFAYGVALRPGANDAVYVTGETSSSDFPWTDGAYQTQFKGTDAFVTVMKQPASAPGGDPTGGNGDPCECQISDGNQVRGYTPDPINTSSGVYGYTRVDLSLPTAAGALVFQHSYASRATTIYTSTLGFGWTHNQDTRLILPGSPGGQAGVIWFKAHSTNQYSFTIITSTNGITTYTPYPGVLAALSYTVAWNSYTLTVPNQAVYLFDGTGKLTQRGDPAGHVLNYSYAVGTSRLLTVTEPLSQRYLAFGYDGQGRLTSVSDSANRSATFAYSVSTGDLITATDVLGQAWGYAYTGTHFLTDVIEPGGITVVHNDYDAAGRAWRQTDGLGHVVSQLSFNAGGATVITDARQISLTQLYDGRNTLTGVAAPLSSVISKTYDANFRPATILDPLSHATTMTWSSTGANLTGTTNALGQTTVFGYDSLNNLTQTVDARGFTTTLAYAGTLLTATTDALGNRTLYTYTTAADSPQPPNLLKAITDPLGHTTRYVYDALGQRIVVTDAAGIGTTYGYDSLGRVMTTTINAGTTLQQITVNKYNTAGWLITTTVNYLNGQAQNWLNRYNLITQYSYDPIGNQVAMTDTLGHVTHALFDALNRPISVTTNFTGSGAFNPAFPDQNITTLTAYDPNGNVISTTQFYGASNLARTTLTLYDALNRPVSVTANFTGSGAFNASFPDQNVTTLTLYDPNGNVISSTQFYGAVGLARTTITLYDPLNRAVSVTTNYTGSGAFNSASPDQNIMTLTRFDANGNVISTTQFFGATNLAGASLARTTLTTYDAVNRPISTTANYDASPPANATDRNITTLTLFDGAGNVISTTQYAYTRLARTTVTGYDSANRPVTVTTNYAGSGSFDPNHPDQNLTHVTVYGPAGERQASAELRGGPNLGAAAWVTTTYGYDNLGRLVTTTVPLTGSVVATTTMAYDALGRVTDQADPLSHTTHSDYDGLGRAITVTVDYVSGGAVDNQTNLRTVTAYDAAGNRVTVTDPKANATQFQYDLMGRLVTVTDTLAGVTRYGYDGAGDMLNVVDAKSHTLTNTYDLLNRLLSTTDPLTHTNVYTYDAAGDRIANLDANGKVITSTYDLVGRLVGITYPAPDAAVSFAYDVIGRRTVTTLTYDAADRPLTITQPYVGSVGYAYDSAGDRLNLKYPDGKVVTYTYDLANRLVQVLDFQNKRTSYSYNAIGQPITTTRPNGVTSVAGYDPAERLVSLAHQTASQTLASFAYTLDAAGNRLQATENIAPIPPAVPSGTPITVTTTADDTTVNGNCSLREAITAANTNAATDICPAGGTTPVVVIPAGTYTLTTSFLNITNTMTLSGTTAGQTIILGDSTLNNRLIQVLTTTVTLTGLSLQNGNNASKGGGLYNQAGNVTLIGVSVVSNTTSGSGGGGIYNTGTITLTNSSILSNTTSGTSIQGGGLYNTGTAILSGASVIGNSATGDGGGIVNKGVLTVTTSSILTNTTTGTGKNGGGLANASGTAALQGVTVSGNTASGDGGGLYSNNLLSLIGSSIVSNTTSGGNGGGLTNTGTMTITSSAVISNTATGTGKAGGGLTNAGGTLNLTNVTLGGNKALGAGGGLRSNNGGGNTASVSLNNVTIYTNTADYDTTGTGHGGGISVGSGTVTLQNTLIAGNTDKSGSSPRPDCSGTLTSNGYNLLGDSTGCTMTPTTGDQVPVADPKLGQLANNGGPTLTYALLAGSPAIDVANPATPGSGGTACAATDQRWAIRPEDGDSNGSAICDIGAYETGVTAPGTGVVITYLYDNLYRLKTALYSTGEVFTYTYDAVGNRLGDGAPFGANVYAYDDANRLSTANGTSYTWDNNGNLLADGVLTYTYDTANRLTAINASLYTFGYNGLGDRLLQNASGAITYTLDLAAGLTQVLTEKKGGATTLYLYGTARLAQRANAGTEFFLADGLGSVRELVNPSGSVTLQKSYDPYGQALSSSGTNSSSYDFTGEYRDQSTLIFLRSRYYAAQRGRFIQKDSLHASLYDPLSLNTWSYVRGNPVNNTDPTGHAPLSEAYLEGMSFAAGFGTGDISGSEIVYDYATMTRARFKYKGNVAGVIASAGFAAYAGEAFGFRYQAGIAHSQQIAEDYTRWFDGIYTGLGVFASQWGHPTSNLRMGA